MYYFNQNSQIRKMLNYLHVQAWLTLGCPTLKLMRNKHLRNMPSSFSSPPPPRPCHTHTHTHHLHNSAANGAVVHQSSCGLASWNFIHCFLPDPFQFCTCFGILPSNLSSLLFHISRYPADLHCNGRLKNKQTNKPGQWADWWIQLPS